MAKYFFIFSLLLIIFGLYVYPLGDPDVFIHLREGKFYAENGITTVNDPFAYTREHQPLKQSEWLFQTGLYSVWKIGGYNLLILLKALLITLAFSLVGILVYRRWPKLEITGLIMGLAVVLPISIMDPLLRFFQERPYIITFIFIPLLLLILDHYVNKNNKEEERSSRKWLYTLPFVTILWANLHPGFIVAFIFLFAHIVEEGWLYYVNNREINRIKLINLLLVTGCVFLCGAINPMGFEIYPYIYKTTFSNYLVTIITEWQSPTFSNAWGFFIILGITWLLQLVVIKGSRISDWVKLLICSYIAIKSYRNIPIFVIVAIPIIAEKNRLLFEKYLKGKTIKIVIKRVTIIAAMILLTMTIIFTINGHAFRLGEIEALHPKEGVDWMMKNKVQGNILANDLWGGFIGWQTNNQIKVFIDGRFTIYEKKVYQDYMNIIYGIKNKCLPLLDQYKIEAILVPLNSDANLFQQLDLSKKWALVYWEHVCLLYLKRYGVNQSLIDSYEYKLVHPLDQSRISKTNILSALNETDRAIESAPHSYSPYFLKSQLLMELGEYQKARLEIEKAVPIGPKHLIYMNMGMIDIKLKDYQTAEKDFLIVLKYSRTPKIMSQAFFLLAQIISSDPLRRKQALRYAKKAYKHHPAPQTVKQLITYLETNH